MRLKVLPLFVLAVCMSATHRQAFSQESKVESARTFLVTIVEARLTEQKDASQATAETLWAALRDSSKTDWIDTVQCTVLDGHKSKVMFGRNVAVIAGVTESPRGTTRNMVDKTVGTAVTLAVTAAGDRLALEIEYQSTRLSGENDGELPPPDVETNQYTSSLMLDLGKPRLLATTPNSSLLILIDSDLN